MHTFMKMRDRRNTSLSVSSTASSNSGSSRTSLNEKRHSSPPPPSPTLPSPVTKENKVRSNGRPYVVMTIKVIAVVCSVIALWHFVFGGLRLPWHLQVPGGYGSHHDLVGGDDLPDAPTALIITDEQGSSRWTVSIPHNHSFPLRSKHYANICRQGGSLRESIARESRLVKAKDWRRKDDYYSIDRLFLEVDAAESIGVLPKPKHVNSGKVCESSLTFAMDTEDGSFGKSLLMLWLSCGLAKREGRAFFVDDTRWPYGQYTAYFRPPPSPNCIRPPPHHILPYPHSARHLLVSAATLPWTFGSSFEQEFSQLRKTGSAKSHRIYELLRTGFEDLFHLVGEDALYAASRIARFKEEAHQHAGSTVGMQIRRGDLHPIEYQYSRDYLPLERYSSAARKLLRTQLRASLPRTHNDVDDFHTILEYVHSPVLLSSDDPEIFNSDELTQGASPFVIQRAQERIQLATKAALDIAVPAQSQREPGSAYVKHVDENSGWEGGFYNALFFSLGKPTMRFGGLTLERLSQMARPNADEVDEPVSEAAMRMRNLVGRAYLLDMAVLGESDGVVCAVSSASCRVLAVMMGWDAVRDGRWMNVDDGRPWSWDGRR